MADLFSATPSGVRSLFTENTQFSPELIQTFTTEVIEETDEQGRRIVTYRSGFKRKPFLVKQAQITGFVWTRRFGPSEYHYKYNIKCRWGMAGDKEQVYTWDDTNEEPNDLPLAGKYYLFGLGDIVYPEALLVLTHDLGAHVGTELLYCGMHQGGVPHGLGSKFFNIDGNKVAELPGLWQEGRMTHLKVSNRLVPVLQPENQEDAENVCLILDRLAEIFSEGHKAQRDFAKELRRLSNELMTPYLEDANVLFTTSERCFKMGEGYQKKAFELREKAVERAETMEKKMEWAWRLYEDYAYYIHTQEISILERYAEWCLSRPDIEVDPTRRFIACKTMAYRLRESRPEKAQQYENAAKALLDDLMSHFEMEIDAKGEEFKAGFKHNGHFTGLVWQKTYKSHGGNSCTSYIGIADKDGKLWSDLQKNTVTVEILDWVSEELPYDASPVYYGSTGSTTPLFLASRHHVPSMLLVERDQKNRCVFCGMHCNGIRNGLGSQFFYNDDDQRLSELQGLWQDGELTHVRSGEKLSAIF